MLAAQDFVNHAIEMQEYLMGKVRLGMNATPAFLRIPELVKQLGDSSPGIELDIVPSCTASIVEALRERTMDAGFVFGCPDSPGITGHFLCSAELAVAAPAAWREKIEKASWQEIAALPWITSNFYCPLQQIIEKRFEQKHLGHNRKIISDDEAVKSELVSAGLGLALLEKSEAERAVANGDLVIWETEPIHCDLYWSYLAKRGKDPVIRAVEANVFKVWGV